MNPIITKVLAGAGSGFLAAFVVDLGAFRSALQTDSWRKFDWKIAASRWAQGAISGALGAFGLASAGVGQ